MSDDPIFEREIVGEHATTIATVDYTPEGSLYGMLAMDRRNAAVVAMDREAANAEAA